MSITPAYSLPTIPEASRVADLARGSRSASTWRAYGADWAAFEAYCNGAGLVALPALPEVVAGFLVAEADRKRKAATLARRLAAISVRHKGAGLASPCTSELVTSTLAGIRREVGARVTKKAPVRIGHVRKMVAGIGSDLADLRDKALLLLGYAGGFRRSELVALDLADVRAEDAGLVVLVRRSKTDQDGRGMTKYIPYGSSPATCPVRAVMAWQDAAGITDGALFRGVTRWGAVLPDRLSDKGVARAVKRMAVLAGLDPDQVGGHSLRSGLVTDGYAAGVAEADIMAMTGHRSREVLSGYRQEADGFRRNVAASIGL